MLDDEAPIIRREEYEQMVNGLGTLSKEELLGVSIKMLSAIKMCLPTVTAATEEPGPNINRAHRYAALVELRQALLHIPRKDSPNE